MKKAVLVVDDELMNREILEELLQDEYDVLLARDGEEAMRMVDEHHDRIAVMLLDLVMPKKNGFAVLDYMHFNRYDQDIPVIVITGDEKSQSLEASALEKGAVDFITRPIDESIVKKRVANTAELYEYKRSLEEQIREQTKNAEEVSTFVIDVLMTVMQARNSHARPSILRIRAYTKAILESLAGYWDSFYALSPDEIRVIVAASVLHDIGEIAVPQEIFEKQPLLSAEEQAVLESHTVHGCRIVRSMDRLENRTYIETALDICRYHHERWDGSGYPDHLVGDDIPLSAQVVGLADTYEGLRTGVLSGRKYTHEDAMYAIEHGEFGAFSPVLLETFKILESDILNIYSEYENADSVDLPLDVTPRFETVT